MTEERRSHHNTWGTHASLHLPGVFLGNTDPGGPVCEPWEPQSVSPLGPSSTSCGTKGPNSQLWGWTSCLLSFVISSQLCNPSASFHLPEEDSITILMCVKQSTQLMAFPRGSGPRSSLPFSLQLLGTRKHLWVNPERQGFTPGGPG